MKYRLFLICLIAFFSFSCTKRKKENNPFGELKQLTGELLVSGDLLFDPWDIATVDSTIIIGNLRGRPLLEIYDLKGNLLVKRFSKEGRQNLVSSIGAFQTDEKNDSLIINDTFKNTIFKYSIKDLINDSLAFPKIYLNNENNKLEPRVYDKVLSSNYYFIAESRSVKGRIVTIDSSGKSQGYYLNYPVKIDSKLTDKKNAELYSSGIAISPDKSKLGVATYNCDMLNIFNIGKRGLDSIWSSYRSLPNDIHVEKWQNSIQFFLTDNTLMGYLDVDATNKYFYAIYSGKRSIDRDHYFSNIIRAVSWDGKRTIEYHCDRPIKRFAVSANDRFIYAVSVNNKKNEPEIVKFVIK